MLELNTSNVSRTANSAQAPAEQHKLTEKDLLHNCRDIAALHLAEALPGMMDRVDDSLFELAEKAENNTAQSFYFEAMREVRIQRSGIEAKFNAQLMEGIDSQLEKTSDSEGPADPWELPTAGLGLVENDELEESLAVTSMAAKIRNSCKQELFALDKRIGWLLKDPDLEHRENPVGPDLICNAFREACDELDADIEVKLIILKLFDKYVVVEVQKIYAEINRYLVEHDVLPSIKTEVKHGESRGAAGPSAAAEPTAYQAMFETVPGHQQLHAGGEGVQIPMSGHPIYQAGGALHAPGAVGGAAQSFSLSPANGVPAGGHMQIAGAPSNQELLSALQQVMTVTGGDSASITPVSGQVLSNLTALQAGNVASVAGAEGALDAAAFAAGTSNVLRSLKEGNIAGGMNHVDDMMIDVVAMMFDYILDDQNIPAAMKALVGRLQIPLLKVAILDKAFFSRKFHPARKLLNTFAEAAVGWREEAEGNDQLYEKMEAIVQRILSEFEDDLSIFSEVADELEDFLAAEGRKAEEKAWWSARVIQGRERHSMANTKAAERLTERLEGIGYTFVQAFLRDHWKNLLMTAFVKDGEESDAWLGTVETMDDLVWSIAPKSIHEDRIRLVTLLPGLLKRLKEGMSRMSVPETEREKFLSKLSRVHLAVVRSGATALPTNEELDDGPPAVEEADAQGLDALQANDTLPADEVDHEVDREVDREAITEEVGTQSALRMKAALERANTLIYQTAQAKPQCQGMGTTAVAARFDEALITVGHVGDSRLYRLRDNELRQITTDHSLRQEVVDKGLYSAEEAMEAVSSNIVTRALGAESMTKVDVQERSTIPDDVYLLCSDGLSDLVEDADIESALNAEGSDLDHAASTLVSMANTNGGDDNISVILVRVLAETPAGGLGEADSGRPLEIAVITDVGQRRAHNEDCVDHRLDAGIVVLADGMGGCNAGEVASALAVEEIIKDLRADSVDPVDICTWEETPPELECDVNFAAINALFDDVEEAPPVEQDDEAEEDVAWPFDDEASNVEEITIEGAYRGDPTDEEWKEYLIPVRNLEVGAWVEFRQADGPSIRARLTWISQSTGKYLFTNRQGHKVVDSTPLGLAVEFRDGNAAAIDDVPLFERAVSTMMARLRPQDGEV